MSFFMGSTPRARILSNVDVDDVAVRQPAWLAWPKRKPVILASVKAGAEAGI
jgi:hypothetical protein